MFRSIRLTLYDQVRHGYGGGAILQQAAIEARALAERVRAGDPEAEAQLVEKYERGLRLVLLNRTGDPHLANDLCQDALMLVIQKLRAGEVRKPESLAAFIRQTAVNMSIGHYRKERRFVSQDNESISLHVSHMDRTEEKMDHRNLRVILDQALNDLAVPRDRDILRLFYLSEHSKPEICERLGLSAAHFDRVIFRAKQRMRKLLDNRKDLKSVLFESLADG